MKNRFNKDDIRRRYYPETSPNYLFKAEQPEFIQPLNQVGANFVKVDFTMGTTTQNQSRVNMLNERAAQNEIRLQEAEKARQARLEQFWKQTQQNAKKIQEEKQKKQLEELRQVVGGLFS